MKWRWPLYTVGRVSAVASRPLVLYLANNFMGDVNAKLIAITLLASSLGLVVSAADSHRGYYARYFSVGKSSSLALYKYLLSLLLTAAAGLLSVFAITVYFSGDLAIGLMAVLLFLGDKLADEVQRFRLFEREFDRWGRSMLTRTALQVGVLVLVVLVTKLNGASVAAHVVVFCLAAAGLAVFCPQVPGVIWSRRPSAETTWWIIHRALKYLWRSRRLWALMVLSAGVGYLDRGITLFLDRDKIALFMLVVMAFSTVQMSVDFYYISRRRRDFLEKRVLIWEALVSRPFLWCLFFGLAAGLATSATVLVTSEGGEAFPVTYIALIAMMQLGIATTSVPIQILYWYNLERWMLNCEIVFWALLVIAFGVLTTFGANELYFFLMLIVAVYARMFWYIQLSTKVSRQQSVMGR
jgi:hypothetical protein